MNKGKFLWFVLLATLGAAFLPIDGLAASNILELRQWSAPDHTRVVIDLDGPPQYVVPDSDSSLVLIIYLKEVRLPKGAQEIVINDQVIRKMVAEPGARDSALLTLFLVKPARCSVFVLKPYQDKPDRLVIDVFRPDLEAKEKAERQVTQQLKAQKTRIIVLDPGHGGEDPGAIGPRGTKEKEVVLTLAKKLQKELDSTQEVRAFLTRRGDYFVSLEDRIKIAQEYGADLLISLHANGSTSRHTRGTSVYCLSLKGASNKAAQLLAQKENASDLVGGVSAATPARRDLDSILLDLEQTHTINKSLQLGGLVLRELNGVNSIQFDQPRQAGFIVLQATEIPSILVETAYITHPVEEKYLLMDGFQRELIQGIRDAVRKFMLLLVTREESPDMEMAKGQKAKTEE
jgi:N-acetylmuramoyl-L-alanine amidase